MISVEMWEAIRRAYFVENKKIREISRELGLSRQSIRQAITSSEPKQYTLKTPRSAPVLGPFKARIGELLAENEHLPRKQRYTGRRIFQIIQKEGYAGSESSVRGFIAQQRREKRKRQVYIPLEFDPGSDAQVDWGEAQAIIAGEQVTVQFFVMRLCYSRRLFVMAFPCQKQEAFLAGHVHAFRHFQGVPRRISYDNLKTAVKQVLQGKKREEQETFIRFRGHYLFASNFCTPAQGHEKGRVEDGVGFSRRNFLVPIPRVTSYQELNAQLQAACLADDQRRVSRQPTTIGEAWQQEQPFLRPLPERDFDCCVSKPVTLNRFSQVEFETNRYSVPANLAYRNLVLKAYPFRIDVLHLKAVIASHPRCYGREQDILDPLHYLPLLEQRPGALEHAKPIRRWRRGWSPVYEELLTELQAKWPNGRGVREFVRILSLHRDHPVDQITQAIEQAMTYGCVHADGVMLCLHQLAQPDLPIASLELDQWPQLKTVGQQAPDLRRYDQLLERA